MTHIPAVLLEDVPTEIGYFRMGLPVDVRKTLKDNHVWVCLIPHRDGEKCHTEELPAYAIRYAKKVQ